MLKSSLGHNFQFSQADHYRSETSLVLMWEHLMSLPFLSETNLTILIDVTWTGDN